MIGVALILMHRSIAGLMGLRFDNNDALRHLPGRPPFSGMVFISYRQSDGALGRAHRNWHRDPAELFRPTRIAIQTAMPLPVYVSNLIESLDVWHNGRVTDFLRFTLPMWMTCTAMALAGAIGARFSAERSESIVFKSRGPQASRLLVRE